MLHFYPRVDPSISPQESLSLDACIYVVEALPFEIWRKQTLDPPSRSPIGDDFVRCCLALYMGCHSSYFLASLTAVCPYDSARYRASLNDLNFSQV